MERLRFKDDNGNEYTQWEINRFSSLYHKAKEGGTPNTKRKEYYENGTIPFVKIDDLKGKYIEQVPNYITEEGMKNSSAWIVPKGSVILSNGATIGETSINNIEITTKQGILGIVPKINKEYLYYLISSLPFRRSLKRITTKGTMDAAYIKDISKLNVRLTQNIEEQEKIGGFLSAIDKLVDKQREKVELLKEMKKGYLQKIFSQELRFKDENGNEYPKWENVSFYKLVDKLKTYSFSRNEQGEGAYKHIHYGDIHTIYDGVVKSEDIIPTLKNDISQPTLIQQRDIVIADASEDRKDLGKACVISFKPKKIVAGLHTFLLRPKDELNHEFFLYYSRTNLYKHYMYKMGTGTKVYGISDRYLRRLPVLLPHIAEQTRIGDFLNELDEYISNEKSKINEYQLLKNGYMQRLFA